MEYGSTRNRDGTENLERKGMELSTPTTSGRIQNTENKGMEFDILEQGEGT